MVIPSGVAFFIKTGSIFTLKKWGKTALYNEESSKETTMFTNTIIALAIAPAAIKLTGKAVKKVRELKRRKYTKLYYTTDAQDRRAKRADLYAY
jgi:hypothetical protein